MAIIRLKKTDVVIVGLGAAGGMASLPFARAGLKVVGLDAGPRYTGADYPSDEIKLEVRREHSRKLLNDVPTVRDTAAQTARVDTAPGLTMNGVGGSTIHYNCQSWRFKPWDFKAYSDTVQKYGASAVPAGSALADWPLSYDELEPYYDKVEYTIGVSGKAGNLRGQIDRRGNIYEGRRSREFPNPPLRTAGWQKLLIDSAKRLDWNPFMAPTSANSREYRGRPACSYCGFCNGIGCHSAAKGSVDVTAIPEAEATKNLRIISLARAIRITTDGEGRATGVIFLKHNTEYFQPADVVFLSSFTYENVRLLLLSNSRSYPNGLSNNRGQVGKYFTTQGSAVAWGLFPGQRFNRWYGQGSQALHVEEYGDREFDHTGLGFIGGGQMDGRCAYKPIQMVGFASDYPRLQRRWGSDWKSFVMQNVDSIGRIGSSMDTTIYEEDRLDLDPTNTDVLGFPRLRVTLRRPFRPNEQRLSNFMQEKMTLWLKESGATETWSSGTSLGFIGVHAYGGTRMGNDPETSVTNKWCISHECPNLAIGGASNYPTTSHHHPTETHQALAWRTAEHIAKNWKSITA